MNFSLITIKNPKNRIDDLQLLKELGAINIDNLGETIFEECYSANEGEISIADFNNCIVINDGNTFNINLFEAIYRPASHELTLSKMFPDSEILSVIGSDSSMMYCYSLVKNGERIRYNHVTSEGYSPISSGNLLSEEMETFNESKIIDGKRMFKSTYDKEDAHSLQESQLVDTLTFDVLSRHLGVTIMSGDDDKFMFETTFKTYKASFQKEKVEAEEGKVEDSLLKKIMSWISKK